MGAPCCPAAPWRRGRRWGGSLDGLDGGTWQEGEALGAAVRAGELGRCSARGLLVAHGGGRPDEGRGPAVVAGLLSRRGGRGAGSGCRAAPSCCRRSSAWLQGLLLMVPPREGCWLLQMDLWNQRDWLRDDHDSTEAKRALPWAVTAVERGRLKGVSHGMTRPCPGGGDAAVDEGGRELRLLVWEERKIS